MVLFIKYKNLKCNLKSKFIFCYLFKKKKKEKSWYKSMMFADTMTYLLWYLLQYFRYYMLLLADWVRKPPGVLCILCFNHPKKMTYFSCFLSPSKLINRRNSDDFVGYGPTHTGHCEAFFLIFYPLLGLRLEIPGKFPYYIIHSYTRNYRHSDDFDG